MKKLSIFSLALAAFLLTACMDSGYDEPTDENTGSVIDTTNIISIQALKNQYRSAITGSSMTLINDTVQIKGWVTGNDEGGNLYNQIVVQDNSGAIVVAIQQSGLYGTLREGQQIVIDCHGLYIGGYGQQAELGGVYTNAKTGAQGIGSMDRYTWHDHYMTVGSADNLKPAQLLETFDLSKASQSDYVWQNQGKLMRLENVTFQDGDGKTVFATRESSNSGTSTNRSFQGISSGTLVFRTSPYAKFAADTIPQGTTNVMGIFTVYRGTWQILARTRSDAYGTTYLYTK